MKLANVAAADFRFFRAFIDGNDKLYEKFIKDCPSELEGLSTLKEIVNSFKKNVIDKCTFVVVANSIFPECNNITICRNYFDEDYPDNDDRKNFKKEFNTAYHDSNYVLNHADCLLYSEDETLTNEFMLWTLKNKVMHRIKLVKDKEIINKFLDFYLEFLENVMDVDKTGKDKNIPWKHLPCLPVYIENEEIYTTFDLSFDFDDDGQTYLNRYSKEFDLIERVPYKKFQI